MADDDQRPPGVHSWPDLSEPATVRAIMLSATAVRRCDHVLGVLNAFQAEVDRLWPEFAGRARILRADIEAALGQDPPVPPHPWQEYNRHGNTCHYPGCTRDEEDHHGQQNEGN
jgi:hypothetical protein